MAQASSCGGIVLLLAFTHQSCGLPAALTSRQVFEPLQLPDLLIGGFIRLAFHSSTRAGNLIHIDGGEINYSVGGTVVGPVTLNGTLTLDVSLSWRTSQITYGYVDKTPQVPVLGFGALWTQPDNKSLISFGGVRSAYPSAPRLTSVDVWQYSARSWSKVQTSGWASPGVSGVRPAAAANTYGGGFGYMLGGFRGNDHAPWSPVPGLLTYDMMDHSWTNESTATISPFGMIGGSLTFAPEFGKAGVLIAMGGEHAGAGPWMEAASNFVPFTNISVWDIATKTWYWQTATTTFNSSDIPAPRTIFCATGVAGTSGSFEIFVFGGHNDTFLLGSKPPSLQDASNQEFFNSVHVLSVPSFTWTKVNVEGAVSRTGHTCTLAGNRQMITIGGLNPAWTMTKAQTTPDYWHQGVEIFDMVDLKWKNYYDAEAAPYVTPDVVSGWYRSNALSSINWSSDGIQQIFTADKASNATLPPPVVALSSPTPVNVAVPVVCGAGLLVGICAFLAWLLHRHFKQKKAAKQGENGSDNTGAGRIQTATTEETPASQQVDGNSSWGAVQMAGIVCDPIRGVLCPETTLTATPVGLCNTRHNTSRNVEEWADTVAEAHNGTRQELIQLRVLDHEQESAMSDSTPRGAAKVIRVSTTSVHGVAITTPGTADPANPWSQQGSSRAELVSEDGVVQAWGPRGSSMVSLSSREERQDWELDEVETGDDADAESVYEDDVLSVHSQGTVITMVPRLRQA